MCLGLQVGFVPVLPLKPCPSFPESLYVETETENHKRQRINNSSIERDTWDLHIKAEADGTYKDNLSVSVILFRLTADQTMY